MHVRRRSTRVLAVLAAAAATAFVLSPPGLAARKAPQGFYGVAFDGEISDAGFPALDDQWGKMAAHGVETARVQFLWARAEPAKSQFDFTSTDKWVQLAAAHGIRLLPVVQTTPRWLRIEARRDGSPPRKISEFGPFMRALVGRYGPNGTFWSEHPELAKTPVRDWVMWNEPHLFAYWSAPHWEKGYGELLRTGYKAVKKADPGAKVVLAGMTGASWEILADLYAKTKIHGFFDVLAVHPYTKFPSGLPRIVRRVREVMSAHGDGGREIYATEFGWSASKGRKKAPKSIAGIQVTDQQMADRLTAAYDEWIAARKDPKTRISRAYWYTWASIYRADQSVFTFSGLQKYDASGFQEKPALAAYKASAQRNEGCAKTTAGVCVP
jgi:Beta-galactosidase